MKQTVLVTYSGEETREIGKKIGKLLFPGSLLTLSGELGAGKTTFTQGLAKGLGIEKNVTSPTFTIMKNYKGNLPLNHIDAYRLEDIVQDLGFDEYIEGDGVTVIEWAQFIDYILPEELLNIEFSINEDDSRNLLITAKGEKYEEVLEKLCTL